MIFDVATLTPVKTLILFVLIVVALTIALRMRRKIEKNEDKGGIYFTPEELKIEVDEGDGDEVYEDEDDIYDENGEVDEGDEENE